MNLLTPITQYAGKKLTGPQSKLLLKLAALGVQVGDVPQNRSNPMTGYSKVLDPLAVALLDFIYDVGHTAGFGPLKYQGNKVNVGEFDRTRYLFLHLWPDDYGNFVD